MCIKYVCDAIAEVLERPGKIIHNNCNSKKIACLFEICLNSFNVKTRHIVRYLRLALASRIPIIFQ